MASRHCRDIVICLSSCVLWLICALEASSGQTQEGIWCWSTPVEPHLLTHPCFSQGEKVLCRCSNTTLDCSSTHGLLQYVPRAFSGARILNFSNNRLRQLSHDQFFANVSRSVWLLDLYNNGMTFISPNVFRPLRKLTTVLIGGNKLSYEDLRPVFRIPALKVLEINCGGLRALPVNYFNDTPASRLQILNISWNNMGSLDMQVLQPLRSLAHLNLWDNKLYRLDSAYLPSLRSLSLHKNRLFDFPVSCIEGTLDSFFPNLTQLDLSFNVISAILDPVCLPRLAKLVIEYNRIMRFTESMFSAVRFPALKVVDVHQMEIRVANISAYTFNNSKLQRINLGYNSVDFASRIVSEDVFGGCTGLVSLNVKHNKFKAVTKAKLHHFFRAVQSVENLNMAVVQLDSISSDTFAHLPRLKSLYLYGNFLSVVPDGSFDQLPSLRRLSLDMNRIGAISSQTFGEGTRQRLGMLDLSRNPFHCGCSVVWFQQWLRDRPDLFHTYRDGGYRCSNVHDVPVQDFVIPEQACLLTTITSIVIIFVLCFVFFLLFLCLFCFGYRWRMKLWLYTLCRGRHQRSRQQEERRLRGLRYDVFLSYAEEDTGWVVNDLLPMLEGHWNLRVCIHQRDFVPGKHIMDNISDCVDQSDRYVLVFSPHFARSQWCQFELKFCQSVAMERDDVMVLLMLRDTGLRDISSVMLAVLKTTTYLEWVDEEGARASFWGRLALALSDVVSR